MTTSAGEKNKLPEISIKPIITASTSPRSSQSYRPHYSTHYKPLDTKALSLDESVLFKRLTDLKILTPNNSVEKNYENTFKLDRNYKFGNKTERGSLRSVLTEFDLGSRYTLNKLIQINNEADSLRLEFNHLANNGDFEKEGKTISSAIQKSKTVPVESKVPSSLKSEKSTMTTNFTSNSTASLTTSISQKSQPRSKIVPTSTLKKSLKKPSFDPYLKYEFKSLIKIPGNFGQVTLVTSRPKSTVLAMKQIDLIILDEQEILQKLKKKGDKSKKQLLDSDLARMKAVEYERIVKFTKSLLNHTRKCTHLNRIIDTFTSRDLVSCYMVMEYHENNSLKTRYERHCTQKQLLTIGDVKRWFEQTVEGVKYLHDHNILHSNLKPSNCLLDYQQNIKLSDFGYLTLYDSTIIKSLNSTKPTINMTQYVKSLISKSELSNENYLPAETIDFNNYTKLTETYCIGAIFYELITSERYDVSKYDTIRHDLVKKGLKTNENFAYLVNSMLNKIAKYRPTPKMINDYNEWDRCVEIKEVMRQSEGSITNFCRWKAGDKPRCYVIKRIQINKMSLKEVSSLLPHLQKIRHDSHLNILALHAYLLIDCQLYILNSFQSNGNLKQKITSQKTRSFVEHFNEDRILKWAHEISSGLAFLHSRNITHGNLKCQNILFDQKNFVKLVDFGFNRELLDDDPEYNLYAPEHRKFKLITHKSDIYMMGACIYKCVMLDDSNKEIVSDLIFGKKLISSANLVKKTQADYNRVKSAFEAKQKTADNHYSLSLKKNLLDMLNESPVARPSLKTIQTNLNIFTTSVDVYKLATSQPIWYSINGTVNSVMCHDDEKIGSYEFLLTATLHNRTLIPNTSMSHRRDNIAGFAVKPLQGAPKVKLLKNTDTNNVFKRIGPNDTSKNLDITVIDENFTPFVTSISSKLSLCCDNDSIYLYNEQFKLIRAIPLLEALETTRASCKKPKNSGINKDLKQTLNLKVNAICYGSENKRLYILISVQNQHTFLNIFKTELNEQKSDFSTFFLENKFHMAMIKPDTVQKMICNSVYLFVCDKEKAARVFNKETGCLLFELNSYETGNNKEVVPKKLRNVNDLCHDEHGNVYIAHDSALRAFNKRFEFIWLHELELLGKITKISVARGGEFLCITKDDRDSYKSRCYIYS